MIIRIYTLVIRMTHPMTPGNGESLALCVLDFAIPWPTYMRLISDWHFCLWEVEQTW